MSPHLHRTVRAVVFDLDGTLVDSNHVVLRAFQHALEDFGVRVDESVLERLRSKPSRALFEDLLTPEQSVEAMIRLKRYSQSQAGTVPAFTGIPELLGELEERGVPMAVWTGRDAASARELLRRNGIDRHFAHLVGGCSVERNKPHPEGLLRVASHLGVEPSTVLMVGDHAHDVEGARGARAFAAAALWQSGRIEPGEHRPDLEFHRVEDLRRWVAEHR